MGAYSRYLFTLVNFFNQDYFFDSSLVGEKIAVKNTFLFFFFL